jgi:hypothetical protein
MDMKYIQKPKFDYIDINNVMTIINIFQWSQSSTVNLHFKLQFLLSLSIMFRNKYLIRICNEMIMGKLYLFWIRYVF